MPTPKPTPEPQPTPLPDISQEPTCTGNVCNAIEVEANVYAGNTVKGWRISRGFSGYGGDEAAWVTLYEPGEVNVTLNSEVAGDVLTLFSGGRSWRWSVSAQFRVVDLPSPGTLQWISKGGNAPRQGGWRVDFTPRLAPPLTTSTTETPIGRDPQEMPFLPYLADLAGGLALAALAAFCCCCCAGSSAGVASEVQEPSVMASEAPRPPLAPPLQEGYSFSSQLSGLLPWQATAPPPPPGTYVQPAAMPSMNIGAHGGGAGGGAMFAGAAPPPTVVKPSSSSSGGAPGL